MGGPMYSKATPSGSFSSNQVGAPSAFAKIVIADLFARIRANEHSHVGFHSRLSSGPDQLEGGAEPPTSGLGGWDRKLT